MATTYLKLFEVIGSYWLLLVDIVRFEKVNISSTKSTRDNKSRKADNLIREISQQNQYNKQ